MRPAPDELTDHPFISQALAQPMDVAAWAQRFRLERFLPYADLL